MNRVEHRIEAAMGRFSHGLIGSATIILALVVTAARADDAATPAADEEAAYTRVINGRADRIVARLGIGDAEQATRVRDLIAGQYRALRTIHDARDAKIAQAKPPAATAVAEAWIGVARKEASLQQFALHRQFVARLSAELTPEQVETVKDGITYRIAPTTYKLYLELLPDLMDDEKAAIRANLLEAREYAMDAGSSEEKHGWFRKYKGRINNYLSSAGYDMKQAEKDWAAGQNATSRSNSQ